MMISPGVPATATVRQLSQALASGALDAEDLTAFYISRIQAQPDAAVFINTTFERAQQEAAASARRYRAGEPRGPLDGIPVAWKDNFDVVGSPTTAASDLLRDRPSAQADADVVTNLTAAGMVTLGKLNMSEFAYSALGLNPHYGTPVNPCSDADARVPGGSSSGCGVAVASGMVPVAIGTDTGGSVRVPAAFNGLVGYKPSGGRYSTRGLFELSRTLDTIGVLARSVEDCRMLDAALQGLSSQWCDLASPVDPRRLGQIQVVVPTNLPQDLIQPDVEHNFKMAVHRIRHLGVQVLTEAVPELDAIQELGQRHGFIASAEAYCSLHDILQRPDSTRITPFVYRRIMASESMSAHDLLMLQRERLSLQRSLWRRLGNWLLAMPTTLHVAPLLAPVQDDMAHFAEVNARTIRNTLWGNMLNACGVAIPMGMGEAKMPTSLLLSAAPEQEASLLNDCMLLEAHVRM